MQALLLWGAVGFLAIVVVIGAVQLRRAHDALGRMGLELADARAELERARWRQWWARNAAETGALDPARSHFIRWALAAMLVDDLRDLQRDLQRVASDPERPESERVNASLFASELDGAELPWVRWERDTGKPQHRAEALRASYRAALHSWEALVPGISGKPTDRQSNSPPPATH
jgi:hypothetical protein